MAAKETLFPFEGLHVYQRSQEAWTAALEIAGADPLWEFLEAEIRQAVLTRGTLSFVGRSLGALVRSLQASRIESEAIIDEGRESTDETTCVP